MVRATRVVVDAISLMRYREYIIGRSKNYMNSGGSNEMPYARYRRISISIGSTANADEPACRMLKCYAELNSADWNVHYIPRFRFSDISPFHEHPENVTAYQGETVRFSCQLRSLPAAMITWTFRNAPINYEASKRWVHVIHRTYAIYTRITQCDEFPL